MVVVLLQEALVRHLTVTTELDYYGNRQWCGEGVEEERRRRNEEDGTEPVKWR